MLCGCSNCKRMVGEGTVTQDWSLPDDLIACGYCGLTKHIDEWVELYDQQFVESNKDRKPK